MLNVTQINYVEAWLAQGGSTDYITREFITRTRKAWDVPWKTTGELLEKSNQIRWGQYNISKYVAQLRPNMPTPSAPTPTPAPKVREDVLTYTATSIVNADESLVPHKDITYVPWGFFSKLENIIKSTQFFPVFITGLSGNGKTFMVEQVCAKTDRKYIRVQITKDTDEDDLIGGFRLKDGNTVFEKGPVLIAMESGAILNLDELDRGTNKLMCIQGVLEGKPALIKKTGEIIRPAKGFNIIATANTKGQGSESGKFIAATILDEAFLERFVVTVEQPYPDSPIEKMILENHLEKFGLATKDEENQNIADSLIRWAAGIRKTYTEGAVPEVISTRRLCHILQTFAVLGDISDSVKLCVARFEPRIRDDFADLFSKLYVQVSRRPKVSTAIPAASDKEILMTSREDIVTAYTKGINFFKLQLPGTGDLSKESPKTNKIQFIKETRSCFNCDLRLAKEFSEGFFISSSNAATVANFADWVNQEVLDPSKRLKVLGVLNSTTVAATPF